MSGKWKRGRVAAVSLVGVLGMALSACGSSDSGGGEASDEITIALSYRTSSLDPHNGGTYDPQYTAPMFDALIGWDEDGNPVPGLATDWELADDAMSLTLTLRDGVQFQDGASMDAEAVQKSLDRARAEGAATAPDLAVVEAVDVVDEMTVKLTFNAPGAHVIAALGNEPGMIVSPDVADGDVATNPVGAGPFKLVSHTADEVEYEAWDGYWDAENRKPNSLTIRAIVDDAARVRALNSGQIDGGNMRPSQITEIEAGGNVVVTGASDLIYYVLLNTSRPGLDDPVVRNAILNGIDRQSIDDNLQGGLCEPVVQPYIDQFGPYTDALPNADTYKYEPEKVKAELEAAGYGASNPVSIELKSPNISVYQELAEVVQDQLGKVGIESTVAAVDTAQATPEVREGKFDAYVAPTNVADPDVTTFLYNWYLRPGVAWTTGIEIDGGQELVDEARSTADPAEQSPPLQELVKKIYEAGPALIPICAPQAVFGAASGMDGFVSPIEGAYNWKPVVVSK
ncbi:MAG: ABC transporter substrate-binding protein [Cumulibacter sp.]